MKTREAELAGLDQFLAGKPEQHPAYVGFMALLGSLHDEAGSASSTLGVDAGDRAFLDGRQSALQDAMEDLATRWQNGQAGPSA